MRFALAIVFAVIGLVGFAYNMYMADEESKPIEFRRLRDFAKQRGLETYRITQLHYTNEPWRFRATLGDDTAEWQGESVDRGQAVDSVIAEYNSGKRPPKWEVGDTIGRIGR